MKPSKEAWAALSLGIAKSTKLKSLSINLIPINHFVLEDLQPGLKKNSSLECLDFSYNGISDDCGSLIAKIV